MRKAIGVYPMNETLNDYLTNLAVGDCNEKINPLSFAHLEYMIGILELYTAARKSEDGELPRMYVKHLIQEWNKRKNTYLTYEKILDSDLENGNWWGLSPVGDPWIYFKFKDGHSIYDHLTPYDLEIRRRIDLESFNGLSEPEQRCILFMENCEYLMIRYSHTDEEKLIVYKSPYNSIKPGLVDYRLEGDLKAPWTHYCDFLSCLDSVSAAERFGGTQVSVPTLRPDIHVAVTHEWAQPLTFPRVTETNRRGLR